MKKINDLELIIEEKIRIAGLEVFAQPIVSFKNSSQKNFEILSRFYDYAGNLIYPEKIFGVDRSLFEFETLDKIIYEESFRVLNSLSEILGKDYIAAINVSKASIERREDFFNYLDSLRKKYSLIEPRNVQFELTEKGEGHITEFFNLALDSGYFVSIDDFGTENFSVQKLRNTVLSKIGNEEDFSKLKIKVDRAFVKNLHNENTKDLAIDHAFLNLALTIKEIYPQITLVAEGIEHFSSANYLKDKGFDFGQGYLWRRPELLDKNYRQPEFNDIIKD